MSRRLSSHLITYGSPLNWDPVQDLPSDGIDRSHKKDPEALKSSRPLNPKPRNPQPQYIKF